MCFTYCMLSCFSLAVMSVLAIGNSKARWWWHTRLGAVHVICAHTVINSLEVRNALLLDIILLFIILCLKKHFRSIYNHNKQYTIIILLNCLNYWSNNVIVIQITSSDFLNLLITSSNLMAIPLLITQLRMYTYNFISNTP